MRRAIGLAIAAGWWAVGWCWAQPGGEAQTVTGFRVPSYDREGRMTSQMFGDSARILSDGAVEIVELRMDFYSQAPADPAAPSTNRPLEMRVTSPRCFYDRTSGVATSDAPVRIARDNMVVTGTGFRWTGSEERLEIYSQAKVVLKDVKRNINPEKNP